MRGRAYFRQSSAPAGKAGGNRVDAGRRRFMGRKHSAAWQNGTQMTQI
jgi:hypothetical protein